MMQAGCLRYFGIAHMAFAAPRLDRSGLLPSDYRHDDGAVVRRRAVFPKIKPLPGAEAQSTACDRNRFTRARQRHLDVAGHVVSAFERVFETWIVLGHEPVKPRLQIVPGRRIGILHDDEAATGMPAEDGEHALLQGALAQHRHTSISDLVGALA